MPALILHSLDINLTSCRLSPVFALCNVCFLLLSLSLFLWVRSILKFLPTFSWWITLQLIPYLISMFGVSLYPVHMEKGLGHTYGRNICQNSKVACNPKSCKFKILSLLVRSTKAIFSNLHLIVQIVDVPAPKSFNLTPQNSSVAT